MHRPVRPPRLPSRAPRQRPGPPSRRANRDIRTLLGSSAIRQEVTYSASTEAVAAPQHRHFPEELSCSKRRRRDFEHREAARAECPQPGQASPRTCPSISAARRNRVDEGRHDDGQSIHELLRECAADQGRGLQRQVRRRRPRRYDRQERDGFAIEPGSEFLSSEIVEPDAGASVHHRPQASTCYGGFNEPAPHGPAAHGRSRHHPPALLPAARPAVPGSRRRGSAAAIAVGRDPADDGFGADGLGTPVRPAAPAGSRTATRHAQPGRGAARRLAGLAGARPVAEPRHRALPQRHGTRHHLRGDDGAFTFLRLDSSLALLLSLFTNFLVPFTLRPWRYGCSASTSRSACSNSPEAGDVRRPGAGRGARHPPLAGAPPRRGPARPSIGVSVVVLMVFAIPLMDGVVARAMTEPVKLAVFIAGSFAGMLVCNLVMAVGTWPFLDRRSALTVGYCSRRASQRAADGGAAATADPDIFHFIAAVQFPIYIIPALLQPLYRRLLPVEAVVTIRTGNFPGIHHEAQTSARHPPPRPCSPRPLSPRPSGTCRPPIRRPTITRSICRNSPMPLRRVRAASSRLSPSRASAVQGSRDQARRADRPGADRRDPGLELRE